MTPPPKPDRIAVSYPSHGTARFTIPASTQATSPVAPYLLERSSNAQAGPWTPVSQGSARVIDDQPPIGDTYYRARYQNATSELSVPSDVVQVTMVAPPIGGWNDPAIAATIVALDGPPAATFDHAPRWGWDVAGGAPDSVTIIQDGVSQVMAGTLRSYAQAGLSDGPHNFTAQVGVAPAANPLVAAVTSPQDGTTVSGLVQITATASGGNNGIARVELWIDGSLAAIDAAAPFTYSWDTALAQPGTHQINVFAQDNAGNRTQSPTITVTVEAPASAADFQARMATYSGGGLYPLGDTP